jgi:hypothetical protein
MGILTNHMVFAILFFIATRCINGQNSIQSNDTPDKKIYEEAVIDAMVAEESEICSTLVVIKPTNNYLTWSNGYVLVVTLTKDCTIYPVGDTISLSGGEIWVTAVPELKDWYKNNPVAPYKIRLRMEQLMGMPADSEYSCLVEIWAKPEDLFRPAYDNEIDKKVIGLNFPINVSCDYIDWFNDNIISSYYPPKGSKKYPWTRLGYTYDWGSISNKIGLTEFVIKKNSKVIIKSKRSTEEYIH